MSKSVRNLVGYAGILTLLIGAPAITYAQETASASASPDNDEQIVVTAPQEVREEAKQFFNTVLKRPKGGRFDGQMARLVGSVCPYVLGLSPESNRAIEERIIGIAQAADLKVHEGNCEANVVVMFVDDGPEKVKELRGSGRRFFGDMSVRERRRIQGGPGPVYGWKVVSAIRAGSKEVGPNNGAAAAAGTMGVDTTPDGPTSPADSGLGNDNFKSTSTKVQSLYRQSSELAIEFSMLLIEKEAVTDLSLKQLSDFAAVHSLIDVKQALDAEQVSAPTILTLFEDRKHNGEGQEQATVWDLAILHALYSSPADVPAKLQQSAMLQQIEKTMAAEAQAAAARTASP